MIFEEKISMKFIHISDVHLGASPDADRKWGADRAKEIEETFYQILSICEEEQVDLLLIAGDLYDAPPTEEMLHELDERLKNLSVTKTVILAGSRDYIAEGSAQSSFRFQSRTVLLPRDKTTNAYLKDINTCVTGYSYGKPEYTERILETINPGKAGAINILLGYGGDANHMPFRKEVLARKGFQYIALGNLHKPAHILKNRMAFSGSLEPLSCLETGRRGYIFGEITESGSKITWRPINKRSYVNFSIELTPERSIEAVTEAVEHQILKLGYDNIYRITLKGKVAKRTVIDFAKLEERYNIYDITDRTLCESDETVLLQNNEKNLIGRFITDVSENPNIDDDIRRKTLQYGLEALKTAGDR